MVICLQLPLYVDALLRIGTFTAFIWSYVVVVHKYFWMNKTRGKQEMRERAPSFKATSFVPLNFSANISRTSIFKHHSFQSCSLFFYTFLVDIYLFTFQMFSLSQFPPLPYHLLLWGCFPPTSLPWHSPILGYRAFTGPRASIDARQWHPLRHM